MSRVFNAAVVLVSTLFFLVLLSLVVPTSARANVVTHTSGSGPSCDSFTASETNLPAGGGDVTFTWETTNAPVVLLSSQGKVPADGSRTFKIRKNLVVELRVRDGKGKTLDSCSKVIMVGEDTTTVEDLQVQIAQMLATIAALQDGPPTTQTEATKEISEIDALITEIDDLKAKHGLTSDKAPACYRFHALPPTLPAGGGGVTLSWYAANADTVHVTTQGIVDARDTGLVQVQDDRSFTLTATNAAGEKTTCTTSVTVDQDKTWRDYITGIYDTFGTAVRTVTNTVAAVVKNVIATLTGTNRTTGENVDFIDLNAVSSQAAERGVPLAGSKFVFEDITAVRVDNTPSVISCDSGNAPYGFEVEYDARKANETAVFTAKIQKEVCVQGSNRLFFAQDIANRLYNNHNFELIDGQDILPIISFNGQKADRGIGEHTPRTIVESSNTVSTTNNTTSLLQVTPHTNSVLGITATTIAGDTGTYRPSAADGKDTLLDFGDNSERVWLRCESTDELPLPNSYNLADVVSVTALLVAPSPSVCRELSDGSQECTDARESEYTRYTITLQDQSTRVVEIAKTADITGQTKLFRNSGYTGNVTNIMAFKAGVTNQLPEFTDSSSKDCKPKEYAHTYKKAGTYQVRVLKAGGMCAGGCTETELASVEVTVGSDTYVINGETIENQTDRNAIHFKVSVRDKDGELLVNWTTGNVIIRDTDQLHFAWNAPAYAQCLPFLADRGGYSLTRRDSIAMTSGNTLREEFDVFERTGEYRLTCAEIIDADEDTQSINVQISDTASTASVVPGTELPVPEG